MSDQERNSKLHVGLILLHSMILISPVAYFAGFSASTVIPGSLALLLLVIALHARKLPGWVVLFVLGGLTTACVAGIYWESWRAALLPAYFAVSLLSVAVATKGELRQVVRIGSVFLLLMLVGGWVAVGMAFAGIPPLGTTSGLHGRELYFYATTMTPTIIGDFMRPAGIYDEPGAFSLVVCVFAFLRHAMGMDRRFTWILLVLGFVTFSLAHLVYVFIHLMAERRVLVTWTSLLLVSIGAIWTLSSLGLWDVFDARLVARLSVSSESGKVISGDNRTAYLLNAVDSLTESDAEELLFGMDVTCIEGSQMCGQLNEKVGFNPLTPLLYFGLLISWPYYLFVAISVAAGMATRQWWPLLAVGLLFMQRPNVLSAGYSMLAALTIVSALRWSLLQNVSKVLLGENNQRSERRPVGPVGKVELDHRT